MEWTLDSTCAILRRIYPVNVNSVPSPGWNVNWKLKMKILGWVISSLVCLRYPDLGVPFLSVNAIIFEIIRHLRYVSNSPILRGYI